MKDLFELKSVWDIQVFLGFVNFYRRFIQGFSRIAAPLTSMLKITKEPAPSRNDGSKSISSRNNNSRPASKRKNGNSDEFGSDSIEHAKKLGKLKGQNSVKSQKLSKLGNSKRQKFG